MTIEALILALEQPYRWSIVVDQETPILKGQLRHANGVVLAFEQQSPCSILCSFQHIQSTGHTPFLDWGQHQRQRAVAMIDPKPVVLQTHSTWSFLLQHLSLPLTPSSLGRVMDTQVGPIAWSRILAVMLGTSIVWNKKPAQWHHDRREEFLYVHKGAYLEHQTLDRIYHLYPLFERFNLTILGKTGFHLPQNFVLPDPAQYSRHQRLQCIEAWGTDWTWMPPWLQSALEFS